MKLSLMLARVLSIFVIYSFYTHALAEVATDTTEPLQDSPSTSIKDQEPPASEEKLEEQIEAAKEVHKQLENIYFDLTERVKRIERSYPEKALEQPDVDRFGGSIWLNYALKDFDEHNKSKGGEFNFDLFRIEMEGSRGKVIFSGQYRFYSYMHTIHHGWVGYQFDENNQIRVGVMQVPFGILPYGSHSYWFGLPYYTGLESDYDAGVMYSAKRGAWSSQIGVFKNAEWGNALKLERFSFDVVKDPDTNQFNEETNQMNLRLAHTWESAPKVSTELGLSLQGGFLYNSFTEETGTRWASSVHLSQFIGPWDMQAQVGRYDYRPANPDGVSRDYIQLGAFADSRSVVAQANYFVLNIARRVAADIGPFKEVTCYEDYSQLIKEDSAESDRSELNTLGCRFGTQRTYTYVDWISGRNTTFLGDSRSESGLGNVQAKNGWKNRFNINFEYYF